MPPLSPSSLSHNGGNRHDDATPFTNTMNDVASFLDLSDDTVVKVSLHHPYYLDDDSVVPKHQLMLPKQLDLVTSSIEDLSSIVTTVAKCTEQPFNSDDDNNHRGNDDQDTGNTHNDWVLDICLDYFMCANPFLLDLEAAGYRDLVRDLSEAARRTGFRCRTLNPTWIGSCAVTANNVVEEEEDGEDTKDNGDRYRSEHRTFLRLAAKFFDGVASSAPSSSPVKTTTTTTTSDDVDNGDDVLSQYLSPEECKELYDLYSPPSLGTKLWRNVGRSLCLFSSSNLITNNKNDNDSNNHMDDDICRRTERQTIAALASKALPCLTMPHVATTGPLLFAERPLNFSFSERDIGADLNLHSSSSSSSSPLLTKETILYQVQTLGNVLRNLRGDQPHPNESTTMTTSTTATATALSSSSSNPFRIPPILVTICRSSDDGFTPPALVEDLQAAVLTEVRNIYCGCGRSNLFDDRPGKAMGKKIDDEVDREACVFVGRLDYGEYEGSTFDDG